MKGLKIFLSIGFVFLAELKTEAQDIKFGLLGGLVVSNAYVNEKPETYSEYRVFYPLYSFNINGYIEYRISGKWGVSAEPGFIQKGGIVRFGVNHYMSVINQRLNYIQIPMLINFNLTDKIFISLGPELAYMITREEKLPSAATGFSHFKENAFELSAMAGLSYRITEHLDVGLRYSLGLTNISTLTWTDGFGPPIGESNAYNQYFQLILRLKK